MSSRHALGQEGQSDCAKTGVARARARATGSRYAAAHGSGCIAAHGSRSLGPSGPRRFNRGRLKLRECVGHLTRPERRSRAESEALFLRAEERTQHSAGARDQQNEKQRRSQQHPLSYAQLQSESILRDGFNPPLQPSAKYSGRADSGRGQVEQRCPIHPWPAWTVP